MNDEAKQPLQGRCPGCRTAIAHEADCTGMWSGAKPGGWPAGGGVMITVCAKCGSALVAYEDVYDERGEVRANYQFDQAKLYWQLDKSELDT
jgi:hypothetical protein